MNEWFLDYNDAVLILRLTPEEAEALPRTSFYKLSLRRYIADSADGLFICKSALTYLDFRRVIALCGKECAKRGMALAVSDALTRYIRQRENLLEQRSRLGIEIKNREEKLFPRFQAYKAVVDGTLARPLRERQMWDSFFMFAMKRSANFSVPGSGKTASVLGMFAFLKAQGLAKRIVVVCPKNAFGSWMDEFALSFGGKEELRALNLHAPGLGTTAARRAALRYDTGNMNLILVNYESAGGVLDDLLPLVESDAMLVFDEVHKVKKVGGEYAAAALSLAERAGYTAALTGTPIPNSYLDLYNLLHILFPDEYDEFFGFERPVLQKPTQGEIAAINGKLQPFFCRTTKEQLDVPPALPDVVVPCPASGDENRLLRLLQMKYRRNRLALFLRVLQLESNPRLLLTQLDLDEFRYLLDDSAPVSEIDFGDYSQEVLELIERCPPSVKLRRCVELACELAAACKPVIIWCIFLDSIHGLSRALAERGVSTRCVYGAVPLEERQSILREFKSGRFQVLLTNPHTLAESVSLHSVCHDAIYFEYSYNLVHLLQSKDRIHRLGLPQGQYTQYTYLQTEYETENGPWSMDGAVYRRLLEKEQTMLEAIDRQTLEVMPTSEEDLEMIFGSLFRDEDKIRHADDDEREDIARQYKLK